MMLTEILPFETGPWHNLNNREPLKMGCLDHHEGEQASQEAGVKKFHLH